MRRQARHTIVHGKAQEESPWESLHEKRGASHRLYRRLRDSQGPRGGGPPRDTQGESNRLCGGQNQEYRRGRERPVEIAVARRGNTTLGWANRFCALPDLKSRDNCARAARSSKSTERVA